VILAALVADSPVIGMDRRGAHSARHGSFATLTETLNAAGRTASRADGAVSLRVPVERANLVSAHQERLKRIS